MAESREAFRQRVGQLTGTVFTVLTTSAGVGDGQVISLALLDFFPANNLLNNAAIYVTTLAEWRLIKDWDSSTGTADMVRDYGSNVGSAQSVDVFVGFNVETYNNALRTALIEAYPDICQVVVDESITVADSNDFEHALPAAIRDLNPLLGGQVWSQINTTPEFPFRRVLHWEVRETAGVKTLVLADLSGLVGDTLRLVGVQAVTYPSTETTAIPLNDYELELLAYKTAEILYRPTARDATADRQFIQERSDFFRARFDELLPTHSTNIPSGQHIPAAQQRRVAPGDIAENPDAIGE